jgi:hypothetical protein
MRRATALLLVSLLLGPIVASVPWNLEERLGIAIGGATLALVVSLLLHRLGSAVRGPSGAAASEGDGWSLVPDRQYEGRFAEAGGIARSEQEASLREVDEQARREQEHDRE